MVASATGGALLDSGSDEFLGDTREGDVITGGVLGDSALNLDGLHPNADGVQDIVARTRDPVIHAAPAGLIDDALATANGSIELWRLDYSTQRPHTSLDGLTPFTFANRSAMDHNPNELWL